MDAHSLCAFDARARACAVHVQHFRTPLDMFQQLGGRGLAKPTLHVLIWQRMSHAFKRALQPYETAKS
jgi:hypothetical protein